MNCHNCSKGFNQPLAKETICFCRNSKKFLKPTENVCKNFQKRKEK